MRTLLSSSFLKKHKLTTGVRRSISIFTLSCVSHAYYHLLKKEIGFSYTMVGGVGDGREWLTLLNQEDIREKTERMLRRQPQWLPRTLRRAQYLYRQSSSRLRRAACDARTSPRRFMQVAMAEFPRYFISLGIYNAFMRYLGNVQETRTLPKRSVDIIARQRDMVGSFYPKVEGWLHIAMRQLGRPLGVAPTALLTMTRNEMETFMSTGKLSGQHIRMLNRRTRGYIYLLKGNQETVQANQRAAQQLFNYIFKHRNDQVIRGHSACPGFVRGVVVNILHSKPRHLSRQLKNAILVAAMTQPDDRWLVRHCRAIITDEGGMLSHAAVVARELKIPCIIGTIIATKVLKDGDKVEVDATRGVVRKVI